MGISYRCAHRVAHAEVKATLLIHGVVQTRQLRQRWPVVVKGVVAETVVGTARADGKHKCNEIFHFFILLHLLKSLITRCMKHYIMKVNDLQSIWFV